MVMCGLAAFVSTIWPSETLAGSLAMSFSATPALEKSDIGTVGGVECYCVKGDEVMGAGVMGSRLDGDDVQVIYLYRDRDG